MVLALLVFIGPTNGWALVIERPVTDTAQLLSAESVVTLESTLRDHQQVTGVQMAVVTVRTTEGVPIEDFALGLATAWGGGSASHDDGLLYVIAVEDRRQRIEVGYGLEAVVQDSWARRLLEAQTEHLREQQYEQVVTAIVDAVVARTSDLRPGVSRPQRAARILGVSWMSGYLALLWGGLAFAVAMLGVLVLIWTNDRATLVARLWWLPVVPTGVFGFVFGRLIGGDAWFLCVAVAVAGCLMGVLAVKGFATVGRWSLGGFLWTFLAIPAALIQNWTDTDGLDEPSQFVDALLTHLMFGAFLIIPVLIVWNMARALLDPNFRPPEHQGHPPGAVLTKRQRVAAAFDFGGDSDGSDDSGGGSGGSSGGYSGGGGGFGGGGASSSW